MRRETLRAIIAMVSKVGGTVSISDDEMDAVRRGASLTVLRAKGRWIITVKEGDSAST